MNPSLPQVFNLRGSSVSPKLAPLLQLGSKSCPAHITDREEGEDYTKLAVYHVVARPAGGLHSLSKNAALFKSSKA